MKIRNLITYMTIIAGLLILRLDHGRLVDLVGLTLIGVGLDMRYVRAFWPLKITMFTDDGIQTKGGMVGPCDD